MLYSANPYGRADGNRKQRGSRSLTLERYAEARAITSTSWIQERLRRKLQAGSASRSSGS